MRRASCFRVAWPGLLAVAAAEGARRLLTPRAPVPAPVAVRPEDHFSAAEIARARAYARPQLALALARSALDAATLARLVRHPPGARRRSASRPLLGGAATAVGLSTALTLQALPLRAISRRRARAAGLDTQSWRAWAEDLAKATAIQTGFAAAAGAAAVHATRRWPRGWWLAGAAGSVAFGTGLAALAPVLLDPIFNDFKPLPEGQTRGDVLALAQAAGVAVREVYSVDASRRTTAANAYVTGIGPSRRVVLFDTLLEGFDRDQIRLVVAHELAHVRHRDVPRSIAYAACVAPVAALAAQRLSWELSDERGTPGALPALGLATAIVGFPVGVIGSRLSRAVERSADHFALTLAGAPDAFISFEREIALRNVADLDPPRWVSVLLASHPPTAERIGAALAFKQRGC